jgi:uncharacterized protein
MPAVAHPAHSEATHEKLAMIERAEDALIALASGLRSAIMGGCASNRPDEMASLRARDPDDCQRLKAIGYRYVTLDLQGYRMGSLNEGVRLQPV